MTDDRQCISELTLGAAGIGLALASAARAARAAKIQRLYIQQCYRRDAAIRASQATGDRNAAARRHLAALRRLNGIAGA